MKFLGKKLGTPSKRLGNKLSEVGKQFGGKLRHSHAGHHGHYLDEHKSDLERHHGGSGHGLDEYRQEARHLSHDIHKHPPLNGASFLTHDRNQRLKHDRKKTHYIVS